MKVALLTLLGPAAVTDKLPAFAKLDVPPATMPPPVTPEMVLTVGVSAGVPSTTVVPVLMVKAAAVALKLVVLVKVTVLPEIAPVLKPTRLLLGS